MSTTGEGRVAEQAVVHHMQQLGYTCIAQNWRTRRCEIDIVMKKAKVVYFIEVKYRKTNIWGDGFEAITPKKMQQMHFAAEIWCQANGWEGECRLMAASVYGDQHTIDKIIEL